MRDGELHSGDPTSEPAKFVSYAQNGEDVLLWRALGSVVDGFYIDVGAGDPERDSVTEAFYQRGWHGINIEPLPALVSRLEEHRQRDINLLAAAGCRDGEQTLFDIPNVYGWATLDSKVAAGYRDRGLDVAELVVRVRTLASVCAEYVTRPIHFLKIDVEGSESGVLRGMDFRKWRPWILVIEDALPDRRSSAATSWEPTLLSQEYRFVYHDGLNRYYVAEEHAELAPAIAIQPNVFDCFITAREAEIERQRKAECQANAALRAASEACQSELRAVYASMSWRITRPLRGVGAMLTGLRSFLRPGAPGGNDKRQ